MIVKRKRNSGLRHRWHEISPTTQICKYCESMRTVKERGLYKYMDAEGTFLYVGRRENPPQCVDKPYLAKRLKAHQAPSTNKQSKS